MNFLFSHSNLWILGFIFTVISANLNAEISRHNELKSVHFVKLKNIDNEKQFTFDCGNKNVIAVNKEHYLYILKNYSLNSAPVNQRAKELLIEQITSLIKNDYHGDLFDALVFDYKSGNEFENRANINARFMYLNIFTELLKRDDAQFSHNETKLKKIKLNTYEVIIKGGRHSHGGVWIEFINSENDKILECDFDGI